ncbi:MAG: hypothetical protein ABR958_03820 [Dehalococcoidales bacterium]
MANQSQPEQKWEYVLGQAFLAASASLLFITTKSDWSIFGVDFFVILGVALFLFSLVLMVSTLGEVYERFRPFLTRMEKATNWLWSIFAVVDIVTIISSWVNGKPKIEQASWLSAPYDWSVPIWLILFTVILIVVGLVNPIVRHAHNNGLRVTARKYSLLLALAFAGLALASFLVNNSFSTKYILAFQSLTVLMIAIRIIVKD